MNLRYDSAPVVRAADRFLASLDPPGRELALLSFENDNRLDWSFIPRRRQGISLRAMTPPQQDAAFALLDASLSVSGSAKARAIIELEGILGRIEGNPGFRDPGLYFVTIFGQPSTDRPWGWRLEGHHLSLNFTTDGRGGVSVTPAFWGANPARVPHGPETGRRTLAAEEDLGRDLVLSLDPAQRARAIIEARAYPDILSGTDPQPRIPGTAGIAFDELNPEQQKLLWTIVRLHIGNLADGLAAASLEAIGPPARAGLHFAWAGGLDPGSGHYYRIHGASVLIEYDNTQNGANHVHTVWRDSTNDFGADLLRRHLAEDHP